MSVNFLPPDHDANARRKTLILAGVFTLAVGFIAFGGAWASYNSVNRGTNVIEEFGRLPGISEVRQLVFGQDNPGSSLSDGKDEEPDIMRVLILGIGGPGHDGSLLTDTIQLASIDLKNKRVGMLSIPRDMAYPRGDGSFEKINAQHAWEEQAHPGEGAVRTAKKFGDFLGVDIDHVIRIDFRGFAAFIDAIGGIDINVERSFVDEQYPTSDEKWTTVSFKKGPQTMDGRTALVFVRSRHGSNGEGSDFARSSRQQLVMFAIREKLLSLNTLRDPGKMAKLYQAVTNHLQSDLTPWDAIRLAPMLQDFSPDKIQTHVLTDAEGGELVAANLNNNYLLFPRNNDWNLIKQIAKNPFDSKPAAAPVLANIELKNGTFRTGFAFQMSNQLSLEGYKAQVMGNAAKRNYTQTTIYDLTDGKKTVELAKLRRFLNASISLSSSTEETVSNPDTDFLVILGETSFSVIDAPPYASTSTP